MIMDDVTARCDGPTSSRIAGSGAHGRLRTHPLRDRTTFCKTAIRRFDSGPRLSEQVVVPCQHRVVLYTLDGDKLMLRGTDPPKMPLLPEAETRFFSRDVDAEVEFFVNDKSSAYLMLHQGGRDAQAVRTHA